jgi:hypothetical protein
MLNPSWELSGNVPRRTPTTPATSQIFFFIIITPVTMFINAGKSDIMQIQGSILTRDSDLTLPCLASHTTTLRNKASG